MDFVLLGKLLQQARVKAGKTQKDIAQLLGITDSNVSSWERGKSKIDIDTYLKICGIYEIDAKDILNQITEDTKKFNSINLSSEEMEIIKAYRRQPELRVAVERVLGVYNDTVSIKERPTAFKIAAREGKDTIELTPDQVKELARIADEAKNKDNSDLF